MSEIILASCDLIDIAYQLLYNKNVSIVVVLCLMEQYDFVKVVCCVRGNSFHVHFVYCYVVIATSHPSHVAGFTDS